MRTMSIPKEPEQVIRQRDGSVLGKRTILKSDHFPSCQNKRLSPQIDGAPNYRKVFHSFYNIALLQCLPLYKLPDLVGVLTFSERNAGKYI